MIGETSVSVIYSDTFHLCVLRLIKQHNYLFFLPNVLGWEENGIIQTGYKEANRSIATGKLKLLPMCSPGCHI